MKQKKLKTDSWPPRFSMDEYVSFVEASLGDCDPRRVDRQKALEERIRAPFRMTEASRST